MASAVPGRGVTPRTRGRAIPDPCRALSGPSVAAIKTLPSQAVNVQQSFVRKFCERAQGDPLPTVAFSIEQASASKHAGFCEDQSGNPCALSQRRATLATVSARCRGRPGNRPTGAVLFHAQSSSGRQPGKDCALATAGRAAATQPAADRCGREMARPETLTPIDQGHGLRPVVSTGPEAPRRGRQISGGEQGVETPRHSNALIE